ncbi:MAG TPA: hypothetical protein VKR06_26355 [Ktedonosporobacter sp.]|nr:hypothetical protein [Ktedonosporobacter sp.]
MSTVSVQRVKKPLSRRTFIISLVGTTALGVVAGCVSEQARQAELNGSSTASAKSAGGISCPAPAPATHK